MMKTKEMIDVSVWQGDINWQKVKASGIEYAIIKSTQGTGGVDNRFHNNIKGAQNNGIKCGVYHYLTATSTSQAIAEANHFIATVRAYKNILYCVVDVEDDCLPQDKNTLTSIVNTFIARVKELGYKPAIYTNPSFLKWRLNTINAPLWLALWRSRDIVPTKAEYPNIIAWQYGVRKVDGIAGDVDGDLIFIEEEKKEEMSEIEKKEFEALKKRVQELEENEERIYHTAEDVFKKYGDDGVDAIDFFIEKGVFRGVSGSDYGVNDAEIRALVWAYRYITR